jgi:hypothetical protein
MRRHTCSVREFDLNNLLRLLTTHSTWSVAVTTHWYMNADFTSRCGKKGKEKTTCSSRVLFVGFFTNSNYWA